MTRRQQSEEPGRPEWSATESCAENARRVLPAMAAEYFTLGRSVCGGEPSPSDLHNFRLAGKRLRYSLELFRDHYDPSLAELLANLKTVQRHLGAMSDCMATVTLIEEEGLSNSENSRRLTRYLETRQRAHVAEFLGYWKSHFATPEQAEAWESYLRCDAGASAEPGEADREPHST